MGTDVSALSERHLIPILMFLRLNGTVRKIDIYDNISTSPDIPKKIRTLEELGLVTESEDPDSRSLLISLTERGTRIADHLEAINSVLFEASSDDD